MPRPKPKGGLRGCDGFDPRPCAFCGRSFTPQKRDNTKYCPNCDKTRRKNQAHAFTVHLGKDARGEKVFWNCTKKDFAEIVEMRKAMGMSTEFDRARGQFIEDRRSIR